MRPIVTLGHLSMVQSRIRFHSVACQPWNTTVGSWFMRGPSLRDVGLARDRPCSCGGHRNSGGGVRDARAPAAACHSRYSAELAWTEYRLWGQEMQAPR